MCSKRAIFWLDEDLILMREVVHLNPFEKPERWGAIVQTLLQMSENKQFSVRGVKDRVTYLLNHKVHYKNKAFTTGRRSGTEEEVTELSSLIQEVQDLQAEFGSVKRAKTNSSKMGTVADTESAPSSFLEVVYEEPTQTSRSPILNSSSCDDLGIPQPTSPTPSTVSTSTDKGSKNVGLLVVNLKQDKNKELEVENRKLALEESRLEVQRQQNKIEKEKLELETRKFEFECEMKKREQEVYLKERIARIEFEKVQLELMKTLAKISESNNTK